MPAIALPKHLSDRVGEYAHKWRLVIAKSFETETSVISFVTRDRQSLVLKLVKQPGDEWHAGQVLDAFDGHGVVRVHEYTGGAMLLDHLRPGNSLSLNRNDEEATDILASVIETMSPREAPHASPAVEDWAKGFDRYLFSDHRRVPQHLVESAQRVFADLCASQRRRRLLHGDLQHYNVIFDSDRGWLAIDPKGVLGELEYEIGAALRNPIDRPELFLSPTVIARRLKQFSSHLPIDYERTLGWAFAQAVLSAIWLVEDGFEVNEENNALKLANTIQPMLA
jgi:streptomycin 6-kinase